MLHQRTNLFVLETKDNLFSDNSYKQFDHDFVFFLLIRYRIYIYFNILLNYNIF